MEKKDAVNWFLAALVFFLMAAFPGAAKRIGGLFGVETTSNAAFLRVIGVMICILFYLNIRISRISIQMEELVQKPAIHEKDAQQVKGAE
jgi:hypothetical protein